MPALKDLAAVTSRLDQLAAELHSELTAGGIDFRKMVDLADDIAQQSDRLATAFASMADALEKSLDGVGTNGSDGGRETEARSLAEREART